MQERSRLRVGRVDLLHFSSTHFKHAHIGNGHGAGCFDLIIAHIKMSPEQLARLFDHSQAEHEIT
jgi:hypothetical protein